MARMLECPSCGKQVRLVEPSAGSKRTSMRCPECGGRVDKGAPVAESQGSGALVKGRPVRERDERRPRPKSPETAGRGSGALIALLVVGGIVLLGGGVVAVVLLVGSGKTGPGGGAGRADGPAGEEAGARIPEPLVAYLPNDTFKIEYANLKAQRKEFGNDKRRYHVPGFKVEQLEDYLGS